MQEPSTRNVHGIGWRECGGQRATLNTTLPTGSRAKWPTRWSLHRRVDFTIKAAKLVGNPEYPAPDEDARGQILWRMHQLCNGFAQFFIEKIRCTKDVTKAHLGDRREDPLQSPTCHSGPMFTENPPPSTDEIYKLIHSMPSKSLPMDKYRRRSSRCSQPRSLHC